MTLSKNYNTLKLENKKFGKLTIIEQSDTNKHYKVRWKCLCECGNIVIVIGSLLIRGTTQSCGCLQKEKAKTTGMANATIENTDSWFDKPKKELYSVYKKNAQKRKYAFNLDYENFIKLTQQNCYYCGIEPFNIHKYWKNKTITYVYNGIDRINNDIGYELFNCVPCCIQCNRAKHSLSKEKFFELIERIYRYSCEKTTNHR